jgi:hypothetical protein
MITKIQVPLYLIDLMNNPEGKLVTRFDVFQMISKVGQEEMLKGNSNWHNQVSNTFQCLMYRQGSIPPADLCYLKSCLMSATDSAKERMAELINEAIFPEKRTLTAESVKPRKGRKKLPSALRFAVWNEFAKGNELCYCCKRETISVSNFECGHIVSVKNGGEDVIQNLRPVCAQCNRSMGAKNMYEFMNQCGFSM